MKNRILKIMMIAATMGAMTAGNIVSVPAAEETTEAQADDSDAELRSQLYGVWPVNLVSYMYMPDGQILDEKGNYLCDYKINGDKIVWDLTNASEDFVGNVKDPEVEIQLLPMDTSKLPKGHENTDYFYAGDNDKMMEIKISQTDDSDPMNPKTAEDIRYSVKSIMDQGSYGKALFYGYTCVDDTHIYIGDYTMIGPKVTVATADHPILPELRQQGYQYNMPVHIGKNCWLGAGVIVLPGITIGDNVVIGAGSIVTKDIPSNVVAVGNPCRVMREVNEHDKEYYFKDRKITL